MRALRSLRFLAAAAFLLPWAARADTTQAWYQNNVWWRVNERVSLGNYLDFRLNNAVGRAHTWLISPRIRYDVHPRFQLQLNTSWIEADNAEQTRNINSFRLELEANPNMPLGEDWTLSLRNRLELRWIDNGDHFNERIRLRPNLEWLPRKEGFFRGLYTNDEFFYDFERRRLTENRWTPLGVIFRVPGDVELRVYYLWRRTLGGGGWVNYHVLGAMASLNF
jgi:hypothetical protein